MCYLESIMSYISCKIIANRSATKNEIDFLRDIALTAGFSEAILDPSGGTTALGADGAPEVVLILQYVGLSLGAGIFAAMGADVWKKIKGFVAKTFEAYKEPFGLNEQYEQWFYNPIIVLDILIEGKSKLQIHFPRKSLKELDESLKSLDATLNKYLDMEFVAFEYIDDRWIFTSKQFKSQEKARDEFFYKTME